MDEAAGNKEITLLEMVDQLLDTGVVLQGDIMISVANVELIYLGLRLILASAERLADANGSLRIWERGA